MNNNMIKERYCSYKLALLFKEKGFDWNCITYYIDSKPNDIQYSMLFENNTTWEKRCCSAPTHQMACDWIYETYGLWVQVFLYVTLSKNKKEDDFTTKKIRWTFDIVTKFPEKGPYQYYEPVREEFTSQYEATEAGLKYILNKI